MKNCNRFQRNIASASKPKRYRHCNKSKNKSQPSQIETRRHIESEAQRLAAGLCNLDPDVNLITIDEREIPKWVGDLILDRALEITEEAGVKRLPGIVRYMSGV